jgi:hypothetical protein
MVRNNKLIIMFDKSQRGTFKYWFAHWCAFQMTALNLGVWRPKYLLHDIEKPFLKIFFKYKTIQRLHRKLHAHHLEYWRGIAHIDIDAMLIDWECSRFTKIASQLNAHDTLEKEKYNTYARGDMHLYCFLRDVVSERLKKLEL